MRLPEYIVSGTNKINNSSYSKNDILISVLFPNFFSVIKICQCNVPLPFYQIKVPENMISKTRIYFYIFIKIHILHQKFTFLHNFSSFVGYSINKVQFVLSLDLHPEL